MTPRTRRRLTACVVAALLILPAEAVLLPVARTPDALEAATEWAETMTAEELHAASFELDAYPAVYRRAILTLLSPDDRSAAWRVHLLKYRSARPELTGAQAAIIEEAIELATAEAFTPPVTAELKDQIKKTFERAVSELGGKAAAELFVSLGPKNAVAGNALPITRRLADQVRSWRVASASGPGCNCNMDIDTCDIGWDPWLQCSEMYSCDFDLSWPMCGPFWAWACTGWCKVVQWPDEIMN